MYIYLIHIPLDWFPWLIGLIVFRFLKTIMLIFNLRLVLLVVHSTRTTYYETTIYPFIRSLGDITRLA